MYFDEAKMLYITISFPKVLLWKVERCSAPLQYPLHLSKLLCKGKGKWCYLQMGERRNKEERTHPSSGNSNSASELQEKCKHPKCQLHALATSYWSTLPSTGRYENTPIKAGFFREKKSISGLILHLKHCSTRAPSLEAPFP